MKEPEPIRTLIWVNVRQITQKQMDTLCAAQERDHKPPYYGGSRSITLELEWPYPLPQKGEEWCVTDLARTHVDRLEWWPTDSPPCRVLHMETIFEAYPDTFDEVVKTLKDAGAIDPYEK